MQEVRGEILASLRTLENRWLYREEAYSTYIFVYVTSINLDENGIKFTWYSLLGDKFSSLLEANTISLDNFVDIFGYEVVNEEAQIDKLNAGLALLLLES
jgi:hypothetical protein